MHTRNPKQDGSNLYDCKPQTGKCPLDCNQCFYNREGAFYVDIDEPHMPPPEEVNGIMRVNCGHDSNIDREKVVQQTEVYPHRFFNTSIPKFDFPAPVVFTANAKEEQQPRLLKKTPMSLMFIRLRVSSTNQHHIYNAVLHYCVNLLTPVVLTFMAYYDKEPKAKENYEWKQRHINSYWCPTVDFMRCTVQDMKLIGGRLVSICGNLDSYSCKDCRNCETYYWQTIKHMQEVR